MRCRVAKGNYEVEPGFLRVGDSYDLYSHWDSSRMREKLRLHPKRYRRVTWLVESAIGWGRTRTDDLERRFGMFYRRCRQCSKKIDAYAMLGRSPPNIDDMELYGLCYECAQPIILERERLRLEAKNVRALEVARKHMPAQVIEEMEKQGWVSVRVKVALKDSKPPRLSVVYDSREYGPIQSVEYRLRKDGHIYNATTRQSYCVHVRSTEGWLNYSLGFLNWDQILELWLLLQREPARIEEIANKAQLRDEQWFKLFPPLKKKYESRCSGGPIILGNLDCRIPGR